MNQLYISTCPETGRRSLCEIDQDNNIAEIFERDEKLQKVLDAYETLPKLLAQLRALNHLAKTLNARQHAGLKITPAMWSMLNAKSQETDALCA